MTYLLHSSRGEEINDVAESASYSTKVQGKSYFNNKNSKF